jgi:tetratricopeptide (TPR) repeat protein
MSYVAPEKPLMWLGRLTKDKWTANKSVKNGAYADYLQWFQRYVAKLATGNDPPLARKAPAYLMYITNPVVRLAVDKKEAKEGIEAVEALLFFFSRPDGTFLFPHDVVLNLHAFLSDSYRREGNYPEAIKYANKLIALSPFIANSYYTRGIIYESLNMPAETLSDWRMATELDKYDVGFFYHYHLALARYKSLDESIRFLEELARTFDQENLFNLRDLSLKFRDCLLVPPEEIGDEPYAPDAARED